MRSILNFVASLRLTVVLLCLALLLVLAGTLAQVKIGLYESQARFFHSVFVTWSPPGSDLKIPVFPGGMLLGGALLINLIAAHFKRFRVGWKNSGLLLTHSGLVILLCGQFFTELFQVESFMRIETGKSRNYAEDYRRNELAFINVSNPDFDQLVSLPETLLSQSKEIRHPSLPFTLRVKNFAPNSQPAMSLSNEPGRIRASQGIGSRLEFASVPTSRSTDTDNNPAALIEIVSPDNKSLGEWTVSTWLTRSQLITALQDQLGATLGQEISRPQTATVNGQTWQLALRPKRYYKPYSLSLIEFKRELYPGSDIPRSFSSKVHLSDPSRGENRDVLIFMNNPLRYRGETFYQSGFEQGDKVTILQVVRNPASIIPYVSCTLISLGLTIQFMLHLFGFGRRKTPLATPSAVTPQGSAVAERSQS